MKTLIYSLLFVFLPAFIYAQSEFDSQVADFRKGRYDYEKLYALETYTLEKLQNAPLADSIARTLYNGYIKKMNEKRLLNPAPLQFIDYHRNLISSKDLVFRLASESPEKLTAVINTDPASIWLAAISFEEVINKVWKDFKVVNSSPDWDAYRESLRDKYPSISADSMILSNQFNYYKEIGQRGKAAKIKTELVEKYPLQPGTMEFFYSLNGAAWDYFLNSDDPEELREALKWSAKSMEMEENLQYFDTYANLLYKLGRVGEALDVELKALESAIDILRYNRFAVKDDYFVREYITMLYKMFNGIPTWPEKNNGQ